MAAICSGNLKGFLRKLGRRMSKMLSSIRGYYRDAELHALMDLPELAMRGRQKTSCAPFSPDLVSLYYTRMTRRRARRLSVDELRAGWDGEDWLGGRGEDIRCWTPKSSFARVERRVYFKDGPLGR